LSIERDSKRTFTSPYDKLKGRYIVASVTTPRVGRNGNMIYESPPIITPAPIEALPAIVAPVQEAPAPPPTQEQIRAAEAIFAAKERESQQVAGLLGLWTSAMILNDLATETFSEPAGDEKCEAAKRKDQAVED
jgi:hypothetical protein